MDPVEGRRVSTLLQVTQDGLPYIKQVSSFFFKEGSHKCRRVNRVDELVPYHQAKSFTMLEAVDQVLQVFLKVLYPVRLLRAGRRALRRFLSRSSRPGSQSSVP
jgi:hypothetical protein